jgi:hypothetical protein
MSAAVAWVVATSGATAACWLAHLGANPIGQPFEAVLKSLLSVLWFPTFLAEQLLHFAGRPFHSAEDAVANVVWYVLETFMIAFVVALVIFSGRERYVKGRLRTFHKSRPLEDAGLM